MILIAILAAISAMFGAAATTLIGRKILSFDYPSGPSILKDLALFTIYLLQTAASIAALIIYCYKHT